MRINSDWSGAKKDKKLQKRSDSDTIEFDRLKIYALLKRKFDFVTLKKPHTNKYYIAIFAEGHEFGLEANITKEEYELLKKGM